MSSSKNKDRKNNPNLEIEYLDFVTEFATETKSISSEFTVEKLICPPMELETAPLKNHSFAFNLTTSPRQFNRFDGKEYYGVANIGDFNLLPAGLSASWSWESTNTALLFTISQGFLDRIIDTNECGNSHLIELQSLPLHRDPQMKSLANFFIHELESDCLGGQLATDALKNLLGVNLIRHYCNKKVIIKPYNCGLSNYKLRQIIDYIESNLDRDLSLAKMADLVDLSEYYFCRMFKESTGVSPHQYVIKARIDRAKVLLQQRNSRISDISLQVGFASQSHFNRHFKRIFGVTPKQMQNQLRIGN